MSLLMLPRDRGTIRSDPIEVPPRAAGLDGVVPASLDEPAVGESDEDWIERSRAQAGLPRDVIAMPPLARPACQRFEYQKRLG